jgi:hypothetical protein
MNSRGRLLRELGHLATAGEDWSGTVRLVTQLKDNALFRLRAHESDSDLPAHTRCWMHGKRRQLERLERRLPKQSRPLGELTPVQADQLRSLLREVYVLSRELGLRLDTIFLRHAGMSTRAA